MTYSGDLTWPDATIFGQNVSKECLEKVTMYYLDIIRRLGMGHETLQGGRGLKGPPPELELSDVMFASLAISWKVEPDACFHLYRMLWFCDVDFCTSVHSTHTCDEFRSFR